MQELKTLTDARKHQGMPISSPTSFSCLRARIGGRIWGGDQQRVSRQGVYGYMVYRPVNPDIVKVFFFCPGIEVFFKMFKIQSKYNIFVQRVSFF